MSIKETGKRLYYLKRQNRWSTGIGALLPLEYKKFWAEWRYKKPAAVHYVKKEGLYERDEITGQVNPVQNIAIPLIYPKEIHKGIWGGEALVQGFVKKSAKRRRVPHFWVPNLKKSILYSEVLNKYMRTVVTDRTLKLIHENYGFDHYLLKTPACDLSSLLALNLKRQILLALADKTLYPDDPEKQAEVYAKYEQYLSAYTRKEIEWYGLSWNDAINKYKSQQDTTPKPLKLKFRADLLAVIKENRFKAAENAEIEESEQSSSWLNKLNPFSKNSKPT